MSWYDKMVAAGRSKSLMTGNVRCGVAAVHEVVGSLGHEELGVTQYCNIKTLFLIFPFLQTNITSQTWTSGGKGKKS